MRGRLFLGTSGYVHPHWRPRFYPASRPARPVTASFVYVRRHGSSGRYQGAYPEAALRADARRLTEPSGPNCKFHTARSGKNSSFARAERDKIAVAQ